jgi:tripartite-type tricarboxylate transporter receptor subunit TctC
VPDLPTVAEAGFPGTESGFWHGVMLPARTPRDIVAKVHEASLAALKRPETGKGLENIGYTIVGDTPEQFAAFIRQEMDKWKKVFGSPPS